MVFICGGCWNKEMVTELLHHLALFYPKLKYFRVSEQTREIANFVMDGLSKKKGNIRCIEWIITKLFVYCKVQR
jgi:hypothetical protein